MNISHVPSRAERSTAELADFAFPTTPRVADRAPIAAEPGRPGEIRARLTLTVEEAADLLGISRTLAYELVTRGRLPHLRLGRRIVVPRRALESLIDSSDPAV